MKKIIDEVVEYLKTLKVKGCITGSVLLGEFEGQDVDLFCYDKESFTKTLFTLCHNKMFLLLDPLEQWKFDQWVDIGDSSFKKNGLVTIKFKFNLSIDVNIILKKNNDNIFAVLSRFDMDIISKGYDIATQRYLDLTQSEEEKRNECELEGIPFIEGRQYATWNKWNKDYYDPTIWTGNRMLRQFERVVKYKKRSICTDLVAKKYLKILDKLSNYENIFNSVQFEEKLENNKINYDILTRLINTWLETHELTEEEHTLLLQKIKEL